MCLLKAQRNSDIGNSAFTEKKQEFQNSSYLLTHQLAELDNRDISSIEARQKTLADLAVKTWQL